MARCKECLHYDLCVSIEACHLRIILAGDKADERCKLFNATADVVPKSEVEKLKIEIEALKIANEKMYAANKAQAMEIFEEIERLSRPIHNEYHIYRPRYAELKKKYTEGD